MMGKAFKTFIPANCIFTLTGTASINQPSAIAPKRPEPADWFTGDIHVHKNCGDGTAVLAEDELPAMMEPNDLDIISLLADMGNGEVKYSKEDLLKVNGSDAPLSTPKRIIHWDAEWHWDATYSNFSNQALGGHLVILGLKEAHQVWDESAYKILEWSKKQNAIRGFCHMQYLNDAIQNELNCCIPIEFPVEAALGTIDFVAEDVYSVASSNNGNYNSEAAINAYYKLLNCGFRLGLAAGTDYPCNAYEPLGALLTYVKVKDKLTYRKWIEGIKKGNTVVSRNGHNEFIELTINNKFVPGNNIKLTQKTKLSMAVKWTAIKEFTGTVELISNGKIIASKNATVKPGEPIQLTLSKEFNKSGWVCARRMDEHGHTLHTAPVYITVNEKPVRASAEDARYFVHWIDNLLENTSPGGKWNRYFTHDLDQVQDRYRKSRDIYKKIAAEAQNTNGKP
jgi:hypothetical protein